MSSIGAHIAIDLCIHSCVNFHNLLYYINNHLFISFCSKEIYLKCYKHIIYLINGPKLWLRFDADEIQPPTLRRHLRRPKKIRKKSINEMQRDPTKLLRYHLTCKCAKCKQFSHNVRSCKGKTRTDREIPIGGNVPRQKLECKDANPIGQALNSTQ